MPDAYQKKPPLPPKPPGGYDKRHNYRPGMRLKKIKLDKERGRLLNILHREVEKLLELSASSKAQLSKDDSDALVKYLKTVRDMENDEKKADASLTPEQLAAIAGEKL